MAWRGTFWTHAIAAFTARVWHWNGDRQGKRPLIGRMTGHIALTVLLLFLAGLSRLPTGEARSAASEAEVFTLSQAVEATQAPAHPVLRQSHSGTRRTVIIRQARPHTSIPDRPRESIITYTVQPGDTVQSIAAHFGLQPTTILWSNPQLEKVPDLLRVGEVLTILPIDGVYHTVEEGDTLASLAEKYQVEPEAIVACPFNHIRDEEAPLRAGTKLIIPNGTKPYEPHYVTAYQGPVPEDAVGSGIFRWPTSGYISQGYWYGHRAIDIANAIGTAIVAADGGYVSFAGWTDIGYGYLIVIDHNNGYQTYYAHLSNIFVQEGEQVSAGQVIGAMGSTGNSTGPHLHFEIRYHGYPTNPFIYLP